MADELANLDFQLEYDGDALRAHEMDVRDLAPALIHTADLFQELNRLVDPTAPDVSVNIKATGEGSFDINLVLLYEAYREHLSGPDMTAAANLGALLGYVTLLVRYLRKRGRTPEISRRANTPEPGSTRVVFEDGTFIDLPASVLAAERNIIIRRSLNEVVRPLTREGIDVVRIRREQVILQEVREEDLSSLDATITEDEREVLSSGERETHLSFVNISFQRGNKWRFTDGQTTFWATISDRAFVQRVQSGRERFSSLDVLRVRIKEEKWRDSSGLHSEVEVVEVLEHIPPPQQGTLLT